MRRFGIVRFVKHRLAMWLMKRNRDNPQFMLSCVPGGTTLYLYVSDGCLSGPLAGGAYLKRPIAVKDEDGVRIINRLGLYRIGKHWLRVYGRYEKHEIAACEECNQAQAESSRLCEVLCPKGLIRQPCPA